MTLIVLPIIEKKTDVGYKIAIGKFSGPASYSSGGFTVTFPTLRKIHHAIIFTSKGYAADIASISGNSITVIAMYYDYDAAADGPAIEVASGTDLSGVEFTVLVVGE